MRTDTSRVRLSGVRAVRENVNLRGKDCVRSMEPVAILSMRLRLP